MVWTAAFSVEAQVNQAEKATQQPLAGEERSNYLNIPGGVAVLRCAMCGQTLAPESCLERRPHMC